MSKLEEPRADGTPADAPGLTVCVDGGRASVTVPADATRSEAAAVAVAVGAHLTDRQRAAAATARADRRRPADPWQLMARLGADDRDRWLDVADGEEWRAAGRRY